MKNFRTNNIYDVILVLNFNMSPIKKNKGSAIFIHISKKITEKRKVVLLLKKTYFKTNKKLKYKK